MKKALLLVVVLGMVIMLVPQAAGAEFVTCGKTDDQGNIIKQCDFEDLIVVIIRVINYLISFAALVAMYYILLAGWNLMTSVGNLDKIQKAKTGISNAVVGFGIIVLAFVFVNLLANGLLGLQGGAQRNWWDPVCIYGVGSTGGCPGGISGSTNP